jgi:dihydropyrimidinase
MGQNNFTQIPNGTGGLEDRMPVLWSAGVNTGRLTKEEFVAVTSANSAKILNIYPRKGAITPGADADIVIWDPSATKTISADTQVSRIDYNVFEGFECVGLPAITISGGRVAYRDGKVLANPGDGKYVARPAFSPIHVANATFKANTAPRAVSRIEVTP